NPNAAAGPSLSAALGDKVFDAAKLSGSANGPLNQATTLFPYSTLFRSSGTPTSETPIPNTFTSPGPIPQSNANTFENAGKFSWKAIYSGDANKIGRASCREKVQVVGENAPTQKTELNNETKNTKAAARTSITAAIGDKVFDTAKLSGAANGPLNEATIEYAFYSGESCSGTPTSETPIPNTFTSPGPIPQSNANTFENAGKFSWKAIYSGDAN